MSDILAINTQAPSIQFIVRAPTPEQIAYMEWRILIQVVAMQVQSLEEAHNTEREEWKKRILDTLQRVNQKAQVFRPACFPSDIVPPLEEYHVQNVTGNWCDMLTLKLSYLFLSATDVDTLKIDVDTILYNVPALSEAGTLFNQQDNRISAAD